MRGASWLQRPAVGVVAGRARDGRSRTHRLPIVVEQAALRRNDISLRYAYLFPLFPRVFMFRKEVLS